MKSKRTESGSTSSDGADASFPAPRKRVTASDVASLAGVSRTTVSIVLSDRRDIDIPETTRQRIKQCAEKLGYLPSLLGQGFLKGRSKLIGIVVFGEIYQTVLDCITATQPILAREDCVPVLLFDDWRRQYAQKEDGNHGVVETAGIRRLLGYQIDGALYFSTDATHTKATMAEFALRHVPVIAIGIDYPGHTLDYIGCDNRETGIITARHLLSLGRASFAFADHVMPWPDVDTLRGSFIEEIKAAGHECGVFSMTEQDRDLELRLPDLVRPPAGILARHTSMAARLIQAAIAIGWRVPEDLAVIGLGRSALSLYNTIPITSVHRQSDEIGRQATELLFKRINGDNQPPIKTLLPPILEIRQSTVAAPPASTRRSTRLKRGAKALE